jgi:DNA-binding transcriptional regulator YhcF (GntR family)
MNAISSRTNWILEDSRSPKYRQIINVILWEIEQETYQPGDKLPSINETSQEYYVSRDTVEKAYRELCQRGIILSMPGKGYFLQDRVKEAKLKVLVVFNKFSDYKKIIYNAMMAELGQTSISSVYIHGHDADLFQRIISENLGMYDYYVIMPHFYKGKAEAEEFIQKIPGNRLILLDRDIPTRRSRHGAIYQDFAQDIQQALWQGEHLLRKYQKFNLVVPSNHKPYPPEIVEGFRAFCESIQMPHEVLRTPPVQDPLRGEACLVTDEEDLITLIRKARRQHLTLGQDTGIISYNDTPVKEVLEGGITVVSTDHAFMGHKIAEMILTGKREQIHNPFVLIERGSL